MADITRIKRDIAKLAKRPNGIRYEEIERIVRQLGLVSYDVKIESFSHGTIFRVASQRFTITRHNRGSSQLKACYVRAFLEAMTELELIGDDDDD